MKTMTAALLSLCLLVAFTPGLSAGPAPAADPCAQAPRSAEPMVPQTVALSDALLSQIAGEREVVLVEDGGPRRYRYHDGYWYGFGGLIITAVVVTLVVMNGTSRY